LRRQRSLFECGFAAHGRMFGWNHSRDSSDDLVAK
jgi:hypothetical protein